MLPIFVKKQIGQVPQELFMQFVQKHFDVYDFLNTTSSHIILYIESSHIKDI